MKRISLTFSYSWKVIFTIYNSWKLAINMSCILWVLRVLWWHFLICIQKSHLNVHKSQIFVANIKIKKRWDQSSYLSLTPITTSKATKRWSIPWRLKLDKTVSSAIFEPPLIWLICRVLIKDGKPEYVQTPWKSPKLWQIYHTKQHLNWQKWVITQILSPTFQYFTRIYPQYQ